MTTRRNILKGGAGLAAILATGKAPAAFVKSMLAARNSIGIKLGGAKLPYDAEVEYIESTGYSWIDTGYKANPNTIFSLRMMSIRRTVQGMCYFGATKSDGINGKYDNICLVIKYLTANQLFFCDTYSNTNTIEITHGSVIDVRCTVAGGILQVGSTQVSNNVDNLIDEATYPIWLFGCNLAGSIFRSCYARFYSFSILEGTRKIRDFIPVRFTNELGQSEGAMYDRVSGQLFRNQGTGAFLYGNDK